jgi:DHA2 family multidrug resistance protein-like MFS transporter
MNTADGLPVPRRYLAILAIGLGIALAVIDAAIANVALPTIARELKTTPAGSIWVVNAYQLTITVLLLPFASLGDIFGYRRVYRTGLVVFTLASLGCALSGSLAQLTVARVVQGVGAAGIMSVNAALVRFIYPRAQLGRGIGINAMVVAVSAAIGPSVAAAILSVASWPWLFAVNVPLGAAAIGASLALPPTPRSIHRFDFASALMSALTFGLLVLGVDGLGQGEGRWSVIAEVAVAIVLGIALVRRQRAHPSPLLPIDLLRRPIFALSILTSVCSFAAQMLAYVSLPFHLQGVLGRSEVETGLLLTPWPLAVALAAPISGRLVERYAAGLLGGIGLLLLALGLVLLATLPAAPTAVDIVWRMTLCGFGFGLFQTPNNRAILTSAPPERSGGASGMLGTARLLGQTLGTALVAVALSLSPQHGGTASLITGAAFALIAAMVSCLRLMAATPAMPTAGADKR